MAKRRRELDIQVEPKSIIARGYFRISDLSAEEKAAMARGERTFYSDALQIRNIKARAEQKGWTFDEEGTDGDLDVSAFKKAWNTRPAIRKHVDDAKKGLFNKLVVFKASRLGRDMLETLTLIKEFSKHGVSVYFVSEDLDSGNESTEMLLNIWLAFAQGQSQDMGAFLSEAFRQRAIEGKTHGALPTWMRREKTMTEAGPVWKAVHDPEQVENMRRLVQLRCEGMGYERIAKTMNILEGRRTSRGKQWTLGMIVKYCREDWIRTMLGIGMFGRGQEDCIEIPEAFKPIISIEEADRLRAVQALYKETRDPSRGNLTDWAATKAKKNGRLSASTTHLLSGVVRCPRCKGAMVGKIRGDDLEHRSTPLVYACPNAVTRPGHVKNTSSAMASGLDDAVLRVVRGALKNPPPPAPQRARKAIAAGRTAKQVQVEIDRLVSAFARGIMKQSDFDTHYATREAERDALLAAEAIDVVPDQVVIAHAIAASTEISREQLRQLVLVMVEKVEANVLHEDEPIRSGHKSLRRLARVTLRFPRGDGKRVFLAPIYTARWRGKKEFWHCDDEPQDGVIAGARSSSPNGTGAAWRPCASRLRTAW